MKKIASTLSAVIVSASSFAVEQASTQPNIIYILADDLGYGDLSCLGQKKFNTPNIDRLAAEGMLFLQHYSGSTVSAPSRSCLMTGLHTGHTPIRGNKGGEGAAEGQTPMPESTVLLPKLLKQIGYTTGLFGKWGLGYPGSVSDPINSGFDSFYGFNCQSLAHRHYPDYLWNNNSKVMLNGNLYGKQTQYAPEIIHNQSLAFIEQNQHHPFFAFLAYTIPHAEILSPDNDLLKQYKGKFTEKPFISSKKDNYGPKMSKTGYSSQPEPYAHYAAMISLLDKQVGEVMEKLKSLGIDKKTIIFFSSDNGPHREAGANPVFFQSNGPFRGIKRDLYEGGIHLPLIAWAPGMINAGSKSNHICAMWDMLPTVCELSGANVPNNYISDGISFVNELTGKGSQKKHKFLYWEFHEREGKLAVRYGKWKAVLNNATNVSTANMELYDLNSDIHEDKNIAAQHPEIVDKIRKMMVQSHAPSTNFDISFKF